MNASYSVEVDKSTCSVDITKSDVIDRKFSRSRKCTAISCDVSADDFFEILLDFSTFSLVVQLKWCNAMPKRISFSLFARLFHQLMV